MQNRTIYYQQAMKEIEQGQIAPVYLLFGEEYLLGDNILKRLQEKYLGRTDAELNYFVRYGSENGVDAILSLSGGMGLFSSKKLLVLKEAEGIKQADLDRLGHYLEKPAADICLVLIANATSLYQSRLNKISKWVTAINLLPLRASELDPFVQSEFRKFGKTITGEAAEMLLFLVGHQLSDLKMQINNVAQYFAGKETLEAEDVEKIAGVYVTQDVFELNRLIGGKKTDKAMFVLHNLLESGVSPQQILGQLQRHFSLVWRIQGYYRSGIKSRDVIAKALKIYPKYYTEYAEQARLWPPARVQKIFQLFHDADFRLKDSGSDPKIVLDILSYRIINS